MSILLKDVDSPVAACSRCHRLSFSEAEIGLRCGEVWESQPGIACHGIMESTDEFEIIARAARRAGEDSNARLVVKLKLAEEAEAAAKLKADEFHQAIYTEEMFVSTDPALVRWVRENAEHIEAALRAYRSPN